MTVIEQLAFDLDAMLAEVNPAPAAPPYAGRAPLHFTVEYFTPNELAEAWDRYIDENGHFDCIRLSHMWHASMTQGHANDVTAGHDLFIVGADIRCEHYRVECMCVNSYLQQAICEGCRWRAIGDEKEVVEAWHNHAWPGWRDLPAVPANVRPHGGGITKSTKSALEWVVSHYPADWQKPGAPMLTERAGSGNRHVSRYSPWGGFDMASESIERRAA